MMFTPEEWSAINALGVCLAADLDDDRPGALAALDQVMAYVNAAGEPVARARLLRLSAALARVCAQSMEAAYGAGTYALVEQVDELPEPNQVAFTTVVTHLNGDPAGGAVLLRHYATDAGAAGLTDVLGALVALHTGVEAKRPTGTGPEETTTPENTHGESGNRPSHG